MKKDDIWTPPKLVQWMRADFTKRGFPGSLRLEAERLVSHALKISRLDIYLQYDKPCTLEEQEAIRQLVIRRRNREPCSYLMETCEFWSLSLAVGPGVLIPRPETEVLVDAMLKLIRSNSRSTSTFQILELGTGSAAIPLALSSEEQQLVIIATDISEQALAFARMNINYYQAEIENQRNRVYLIQGDRFNSIKRQPIYDCIVSNPPYIPTQEIDLLQEEVRLWEPRNALNGGDDGLAFYHYLQKAAESLLKPGGFLIFEHGFDQRESIQQMMSRSTELTLFKSIKDYAEHDRVLIFRKSGS
ncbi:MAG: peptide chain release factor N(5)-glutamine methyltransferase [Deltaproteobacteria bacterium]|jgi:release factor glutamine methyltransferase|nr:peptide chain release factor N(5)-glutamine methyltransferase [Deltaproteobacteria bacterium]MBT4266390.1 peptide chain release factor N(5)-glutamine methyltransferase [Deltaproteobacteria bacterium]MBT4643926.1 peptide chain release factor N(5)-glutamine methyltransferase [Deltaproteobacteria bacterium]MBT6499918.1 peptide chain release factor N(5)-glutamine methyltransferase [Deltaproteobacteria bacterium]MBT6610886.1 peptide chain release factor N(5)-glutamine methyltransferase [Deltaprot